MDDTIDHDALVLQVSLMGEELDKLQRENKKLTDALHERRCHPDFEYATTKVARKSGEIFKPEGDSWEPNTYGPDPHSAWERFDFHEEYYWRRLKVRIDPTKCQSVYADKHCQENPGHEMPHHDGIGFRWQP